MVSNNTLMPKSEQDRTKKALDNVNNILRILTLLEKALQRLMRMNYHNRSQYPPIILEVEEALNKLRSLIQDYKNFANLAGYNLTLGMAVKDLGDIIGQLIAECQPCAGKRQIKKTKNSRAIGSLQLNRFNVSAYSALCR